jgi:hypothetical protein
MSVMEQRRRDARRALENVHREQDRWLATYMRPIGALWDRMNGVTDPWATLGDPWERLADEDENGRDDAIPVEHDNAPLHVDQDAAVDADNDPPIPGPLPDFISADAQPPSADDETPIRSLPMPQIQQNEQEDGKQEEHEQEHRQNDKPCCHIL